LEEINICRKYLLKQIEIIDPKIICTMGKYSTQLILNTDAPITKLRGKVFRIKNKVVLPINHPAAALYTPSRFGILKEDFQRIKMILDNYENQGDIFSIDDIAKTGMTGITGKTEESRTSCMAGTTIVNGSFVSEAASSLLSDSNFSTGAEKIPPVLEEPDLQKSKNEQLGLF
jgi:hypothetical protein